MQTMKLWNKNKQALAAGIGNPGCSAIQLQEIHPKLSSTRRHAGFKPYVIHTVH